MTTVAVGVVVPLEKPSPVTVPAVPPIVTRLELVGVNTILFCAFTVALISPMAASALLSPAKVEIWPLPLPNVSVFTASVPTWTVSVLLAASPANVEL